MKGVQSVTADRERILVKKISPIILWVSDFSRCLSFYRKALGMNLQSQAGEWAEFDVGGVTLALHGTSDGGPQHSAKAQDAPVNLHFVTKDMEKLGGSLEDWGTAFVEGPEEKDYDGWKVLEAAVEDPDGNRFEVIQEL